MLQFQKKKRYTSRFKNGQKVTFLLHTYRHTVKLELIQNFPTKNELEGKYFEFDFS